MINRDEIEWELKSYLRIPGTGQHEFCVWLNKPLSDWDVYDEWERARTRHMVQNLNKGEILFDIGAEFGWLSVVYGQIVGPSNMVLIEPTPEFWPNIETLWHKNFDAEPLAAYCGLFSDKTTSKTIPNGWPKDSQGDLIEKLKYTSIWDNDKKIPEITLDDYVRQTGIVPNAITIDTEGAEFNILKGSTETLERKNVKVWASIHPDLLEKHYGKKRKDVLQLMEGLGYSAIQLSVDHEEHWYFWKGQS